MVAVDLEQSISFFGIATDSSAVAETAQVFAGEETESTVVTDGTHPAALVFSTDSLTGIFDHKEVVLGSKFHNGIHIGGLSEKVNRDDRTGLGSDLFGGFDRVDVKGDRINVSKNRLGTGTDNSSHGGKESKRRGDDLIAGFDLFDHQGDQQGIRTAGDADAADRIAVAFKFFLKFFDFAAENETLGIANFGNFL